MSNKTNMLNDILGNLEDSEQSVIEKVAVANTSITNTETPGTGKKAPVDAPTHKEKKLGLGGLSGLQKELFHEVPTVGGSKSDGGTTGNDEKKPSKVEPGLTFEKKASSDILGTLMDSAGMEYGDLGKEASAQEDDGLLKIAFDTIGEMNDLEKVADDMAERAATKFFQILADKA